MLLLPLIPLPLLSLLRLLLSLVPLLLLLLLLLLLPLSLLSSSSSFFLSKMILLLLRLVHFFHRVCFDEERNQPKHWNLFMFQSFFGFPACSTTGVYEHESQWFESRKKPKSSGRFVWRRMTGCILHFYSIQRCVFLSTIKLHNLQLNVLLALHVHAGPIRLYYY